MVFTLCVDDFGMKYIGKQHASHLLDAFCARYKIKCDWTGSLYLGLTIDWGYKRRRIMIPMPEYIPNVLLRFKHSTPIFNQYIPYTCARVVYGKPQYTMQEDPPPKTSINCNTMLTIGGGNFTILQFSGGMYFFSSSQRLIIGSVKCKHQNVG